MLNISFLQSLTDSAICLVKAKPQFSEKSSPLVSNAVCRTRPALCMLEDMQKEAGSLPAAVPETEALVALIERAAEWQAKAAALAAQKAPLKKMREVLHLGLRMPVEVPQVESLRAEIRRREWEDAAKKV